MAPKATLKIIDQRATGFENTVDMHIQIENDRRGAVGEEQLKRQRENSEKLQIIGRFLVLLAVFGMMGFAVHVYELKQMSWKAQEIKRKEMTEYLELEQELQNKARLIFKE